MLPEKEFIDKADIQDPEEIGNLCAKLKKGLGTVSPIRGIIETKSG